ncbi:UDP-glucose 4-epimerase GalE [Pelagibacterales bacterium SAG-MED17]|nr:UDP-glucose 4-epimerase GalE [Pelagibacterales bacterium SAG-MED17]
MTNVIVTGGAGYIGSHVCKILKKRNINPVTIDNLTNGYKSFVKWGPLEKTNLKNYNKLNRIFKKYKPIAVIHLAAKIESEKSVQNPINFYENNISDTITLLKVMEKNNVNKIIFSSSAAVYQSKNKKNYEKDALKPSSPYGFTKLTVESLINDYSKNKKLKYIFLRFFNAAGADSMLDIGERHKEETHLIPLAIDAAYKGKTLKVFGINYKTKDGSAVRDYIHVSDLANSHYLSLKYLIKKNSSQIFNVGFGKGYSVLEIVKLLKKKLNIRYKITKKRKGDNDYLVSNISKIKKILRFKPTNNIHSILDTAINYYKKINGL